MSDTLDFIKLLEKRYILSFDIGIHNLAVCVITYTKPISSNVYLDENESKYQLYDWRVMDINKKSCSYQMKKGGMCQANCGYFVNESSGGGEKYYCGKHKVVGAKKIKDTYFEFNKNLYILLKEMMEEMQIPLMNIEAVLIEQQPLKNPKMKNISYMLHGYFMKDFVDIIETDKKTFGEMIVYPQIEFISPKNKLEKKYQTFLGNLGVNIAGITAEMSAVKDKYKHRKMTSIKIVEGLISETNESSGVFLNVPATLRGHFSDKKKQDDLADCLLQGIWFIFSGGISQ
jgi:hypothetical protein